MFTAGDLGCFIPGEEVSVVFCDFLAGSLVGFKETHVLGGEVYGPKLSAAIALHQVLIVSAENCLHEQERKREYRYLRELIEST